VPASTRLGRVSTGRVEENGKATGCPRFPFCQEWFDYSSEYERGLPSIRQTVVTGCRTTVEHHSINRCSLFCFYRSAVPLFSHSAASLPRPCSGPGGARAEVSLRPAFRHGQANSAYFGRCSSVVAKSFLKWRRGGVGLPLPRRRPPSGSHLCSKFVILPGCSATNRDVGLPLRESWSVVRLVCRVALAPSEQRSKM